MLFLCDYYTLSLQGRGGGWMMQVGGDACVARRCLNRKESRHEQTAAGDSRPYG